MADHVSAFGLAEKVNIDGSSGIEAFVTGILFKPGRVVYELSWFSNGTEQQAVIDEWRLKHAE